MLPNESHIRNSQENLKNQMRTDLVKTSGFARNLNVLTLRLLMSYIYGAPSKARNANVVYIWTYVWQR